jgi:hypothetical protein
MLSCGPALPSISTSCRVARWSPSRTTTESATCRLALISQARKVSLRSPLPRVPSTRWRSAKTEPTESRASQWVDHWITWLEQPWPPYMSVSGHSTGCERPCLLYEGNVAAGARAQP